MSDWKPAASIDRLRSRAALLASIRSFFAARQVLEVETPLLAPTTATDVYIQSFPVLPPTSPEPAEAASVASTEHANTSQARAVQSNSRHAKYLQTSPEFAMKRLLAAGSGAIYQLCKAFRVEESSKRHNPEFTLLEWYRPGFTLTDLMDEVEQLLQAQFDCGEISRLSYRELFLQHLEFDPHAISFDELKKTARSRINFTSDDLTATDYLQMLLAKLIEPQLPDYCFIYDYPVAQAALATIESDALGQDVARRFELFGKGMEIANGYYELTSAEEQRARFVADNARREKLGLPQYPIDEKLLAALTSGIPDCSGVALGVDRLLMIQLGLTDIRDVISFTAD